MRKILTTATLVLVLYCSAFAGIMHTPGSPEPVPTPTPTSAVQEPTDDATLNGEISDPPGVTEILTETALDLLAALPTLL